MVLAIMHCDVPLPKPGEPFVVSNPFTRIFTPARKEDSSIVAGGEPPRLQHVFTVQHVRGRMHN